MNRADLLIVGAGPAGMAAAIVARRYGLEVVVVDEQATPGGQIWRSVEKSTQCDEVLGPTYVEGREVAEAFRSCGAIYKPGAQLWQVETGFRAFVSEGRKSQQIDASALILATGAQERPVPFPGWTLPGVMTVGAAQILLKNAGQIPRGPVWVAGCGPLPLLYMTQLIRAGGRIAGYLDTTPPGQWRAAVRHIPSALRASGDLVKGLSWMIKLKASKTQIVKGVVSLEAHGNDRLETVVYRASDGSSGTVVADTLLVHEGVIPNIHPALSLNCKVEWNSAQECFIPSLDSWGESSEANLFVAGDGAGIGGAKAAQMRGKLAALRIAMKLGRISGKVCASESVPIRRKLDRELAVRPFLDALFKAREEVYSPVDQTIVCRCEEVTAAQIRECAAVGRPGPNQIKAATRAGMGPCQGRQCGYTVTRILSAIHQCAPAEIGFYHIRPPLKPVTLGELASLDGRGLP